MSTEGKSAIEYMASLGIVQSGADLKFNPKSDATRAQVAKMMYRFCKSTDLY